MQQNFQNHFINLINQTRYLTADQKEKIITSLQKLSQFPIFKNTLTNYLIKFFIHHTTKEWFARKKQSKIRQTIHELTQKLFEVSKEYPEHIGKISKFTGLLQVNLPKALAPTSIQIFAHFAKPSLIASSAVVALVGMLLLRHKKIIEKAVEPIKKLLSPEHISKVMEKLIKEGQFEIITKQMVAGITKQQEEEYKEIEKTKEKIAWLEKARGKKKKWTTEYNKLTKQIKEAEEHLEFLTSSLVKELVPIAVKEALKHPFEMAEVVKKYREKRKK
jgi:hypothetical protein